MAVLHSAALGELAATPIKVRPETAAAIVVAADGYPTSPVDAVPIPDVDVPAGVQLIHAGTRFDDDRLVSSGGRILNVVGTGSDLAAALEVAYPVVEQLTGKGLFARSDIGWRHAPRPSKRSSKKKRRKRRATGSDGAKVSYEDAGVSFRSASMVTSRIAAAVTATHDDRVVAGHGSFGGVFDVARWPPSPNRCWWRAPTASAPRP